MLCLYDAVAIVECKFLLIFEEIVRVVKVYLRRPHFHVRVLVAGCFGIMGNEDSLFG